MFNLLNKEEGVCIIYRSGFIDAAKCIVKNEVAEKVLIAYEELDDMFMKMIESFGVNSKVIMRYFKHKDTEGEEFRNINDFKNWLVKNQASDAILVVLRRLKQYCKKNNIELPNISIIFGDSYHDAIFNTDMYFNNTYDREWLNNELTKKMIKDIDKSEIIDSFAIKSPVFGIMPIEKLSGGVKTLILIYNNPAMVFNASTCGDNCAKWIKKFAEEKDFVINLYHAMVFPNNKLNAYIVNGGEIIHSMDELYVCADKYCRSQG